MRIPTRLSIPLLAIVAAVIAAGGAFRPGPAPSPAEAAACNKAANPGNLQTVVDGSHPGDVICLAGGVYYGPIGFFNKSGVTVRGQGNKANIVVGGQREAILIFNSHDITLDNFTLFIGHASDAYINNSYNIALQSMDIGGGARGVLWDANSNGRISDGHIYSMENEGVIVRSGSSALIERTWVFSNNGVGVSILGQTGTTTIRGTIVSDNGAVGIFAGQPGCAPLPPAQLGAPACYRQNPNAYVTSGNVVIESSLIRTSSPGIVMFPGTNLKMKLSKIWSNRFTGLFAWGARISSEGDEYADNEEHAIELRSYPDPFFVGFGYPLRGGGGIVNDDVHNSRPLPGPALGGGVLAQGADVAVVNSNVHNNFGIGVSFANSAGGWITGNGIYNNGGSAICLYNANYTIIGGNNIFGNRNNTIGVCAG